MVIAHDPWKTKEYTLECDRQKELKPGEPEPAPHKPTTWIFRALLEHEMVSLLDGATRDGAGTQAHTAVVCALVGVRDFNDKKGKPIVLKRESDAQVPQDFMNLLEWNWISELAGEIGAYSKMSSGDVEKPAPSPTE